MKNFETPIRTDTFDNSVIMDEKNIENPNLKDNFDEIPEEATWTEVFHGCCCHTSKEWIKISGGLFLVLFFLYFFLFALDLLGNSAKVVGGCTVGSLFGDDQNPVAGVMIGMLVTVLMQSSSTTSSIVVALVGADAISIKAGIYMIMGANIGTSVTNTLVALGQMGNGDQLERAFAGATVHDLFNFLTVGCLFIIEVITHFLYHFTKSMVPDDINKLDKFKGPVKKWVGPLTKKVIIANKDVIKKISNDQTCSDFYPTKCLDDIVSYTNCKTNTETSTMIGLINCDKSTDECPAFFKNGASKSDDMVSGGVCLFLSIVILVVCLIGLITVLGKMLSGASSRVINKASNINGYLAIVIGAGITMLVQSSSITTSTLTPLVGMGVISLEKMYPLTLGANIGTTMTSLLAAMVSAKPDALQVALCHIWFNIIGILIWYPIPFLRKIPLMGARQLGKATRKYGYLFPILYILVVFIITPIIIFLVSSLFVKGSKGYTTLGIILVIAMVISIIYFFLKWNKFGGRESFNQYFENRTKRKQALSTLADDMSEVKSDIAFLKEHFERQKNEEEKIALLNGDIESKTGTVRTISALTLDALSAPSP